MTLDAALVTRKLLLIASDLESVRALHTRGEAAYLGNRIEQAVCERLIERIVTRMIDINYHVLTATGHAPPNDYFTSFVQMGRAGILEPGFAARIARAAGLRNRLVHDYDDLDQRLLFEALGDVLRDVPVYASAVQRITERDAPG